MATNAIDLYDLAGGGERVTALADAFYRRVLADPLLVPLFRDPSEDHAGRMALFLTELLGGPAGHTAERGGPSRMFAAHRGLRIAEAQRARWVEHMTAAVAEVDLHPVVRDALADYVAFGSRAAMSTSHAG